MEVLYHIRPYFGGISPYIALSNRPYISQVPRIWVPGMAIPIKPYTNWLLNIAMENHHFQQVNHLYMGHFPWLCQSSPEGNSIFLLSVAKSPSPLCHVPAQITISTVISCFFLVKSLYPSILQSWRPHPKIFPRHLIRDDFEETQPQLRGPFFRGLQCDEITPATKVNKITYMRLFSKLELLRAVTATWFVK